jgi:glycosyltransferase involved in cell wall biosynthesis
MVGTLHQNPAETDFSVSRFSAEEMTVAVIIPTFNYAHFLADAITSVLAQTHPADEIIVVDDGSTDDPGTIVAKFADVRLIQQKNRGLSAARNTGLWNCKASHVVFLDADDRLLPNAIEAGVACIANYPDCAFVYGGCRFITKDGHSWFRIPKPIDEPACVAFLRYQIDGIMNVLFRRDYLLAVDGFDEAIRRFEDRDIYLRLAARYPVASHSTIVGEYQKHGNAMSDNYVEMLTGALLVLDLNEARVAAGPIGGAAVASAAREGRNNFRNYYVSKMLDAAAIRWRAHRDVVILGRDLIQAARWSPSITLRSLLRAVTRRASKVFTRSLIERAITNKDS